MSKKKNKNTPLTEEQIQKRQKTALKRKIRSIFEGAGFEYIPTNDKEMHIGRRDVEIDSLFIYENVWLVCEDTVKTSNITDHVRTKNEAVGEIKSNLSAFIQKLTELFPEKEYLFHRYTDSRRPPKILCKS